MKIKNFTTEQLQELYKSNKIFFLNYRKVYQLNYTENAGFSFTEIERLCKPTGLPITLRGRYFAQTPEQLNNYIKDHRTI